MVLKNKLFYLTLLAAWLNSSLLYAQKALPVATHIDSLRAARSAKIEYEPAILTFVSGKRVKAWLSFTAEFDIGSIGGYITCFRDRVACYETDPEALPRPTPKAVSVERLMLMEVDGPQQKHRYELLKRRGKSMGILAENLAQPGPMELFGYAETKNDMLIPIPLPYGVLLIPTGTHEKYHWYVRLNGGELEELPSGNGTLRAVMADLCIAVPTLVAELESSHSPHNAANLQQLVNCYNETLTAK